MHHTPNTVAVCKKIGEFYLNKNEGDYEKAQREVQNLGISEVIATGDSVLIKLSRPGLFIGKRGENMDKLGAFLEGKRIHIVEVDSITDLIGPRKEPEYPDYVEADIPDPLPDSGDWQEFPSW